MGKMERQRIIKSVSVLSLILVTFIICGAIGPLPKVSKQEVNQEVFEVQEDFINDAWFQKVNKGEGVGWWKGTVLKQRSLMPGIHQVKVRRNEDAVVFLGISGQEQMAGSQVEVEEFVFRYGSPATIQNRVYLVW
jgi:hypothetical protein